jgi:hypothetical protein
VKKQHENHLKMPLPIFWEIIRQKTIVMTNLVKSYKAIGFNLLLQVHFLDSHSDFFPEYLRAVSEQHRGWFHQDISTTEKWYDGKWSSSMLADYFHTQNVAESQIQLLFDMYKLSIIKWRYRFSLNSTVSLKNLVWWGEATCLNSAQKMLFSVPTLVCVTKNKNYFVIQLLVHTLVA